MEKNTIPFIYYFDNNDNASTAVETNGTIER